MTLVIDASLTLAWYFEDESSPQADAVLDQVLATGAIVPALWHFEVANGFQVAVRRKRIDTSYRDGVLRRLAKLKVAIDDDGEAQAWTTVLQLSDTQKLTVYDAAYLELAQRRGLPLGTLDRELARAAGALRITVLGR